MITKKTIYDLFDKAIFEAERSSFLLSEIEAIKFDVKVLYPLRQAVEQARDECLEINQNRVEKKLKRLRNALDAIGIEWK